jgi:hypothetical protein
VHSPPSPGWADFTIMIECTPESGHCRVYLYHRSAPIESVAMSKQGLTVMFSKCPATEGHLIAKYIKCTQTRYISCKNTFQPIYSFVTAFNFPLEICRNMHSFELFICEHSAPYTSAHSCVRDTFWLMLVTEK